MLTSKALVGLFDARDRAVGRLQSEAQALAELERHGAYMGPLVAQVSGLARAFAALTTAVGIAATDGGAGPGSRLVPSMASAEMNAVAAAAAAAATGTAGGAGGSMGMGMGAAGVLKPSGVPVGKGTSDSIALGPPPQAMPRAPSFNPRASWDARRASARPQTPTESNPSAPVPAPTPRLAAPSRVGSAAGAVEVRADTFAYKPPQPSPRASPPPMMQQQHPQQQHPQQQHPHQQHPQQQRPGPSEVSTRRGTLVSARRDSNSSIGEGALGSYVAPRK